MNPKWKLIEKILQGSKTIESRFYVNRISPWNKIKEGETIYFKNSAKPVTAKATIAKVLQYEDLNIRTMEDIFKKYGRLIWPELITFEQWYESKKNKRYGILIFLKDPVIVKPFNINKEGFGSASAWMCVENLKSIRKG